MIRSVLIEFVRCGWGYSNPPPELRCGVVRFTWLRQSPLESLRRCEVALTAAKTTIRNLMNRFEGEPPDK